MFTKACKGTGIRASVVVATYNNPHFLSLTLSGFQRQSCREFEIIVADDGSGPETRKVVDQYRTAFAHPIQHIWHKDQGWRKNVALNESLRKSSSNYLIFVDQDCVPHTRFVEEHLRHSREGVFLAGRKVILSRSVTSKLENREITSGKLEKAWSYLLFLNLTGRLTHWEDAVWVPPFLRWLIRRRYKTLVGSNFSVHKSDLLRINGFDEEYLGPAIGEDEDVAYRLSLLGIKGFSIRNRAIQYHLYHKDLPRTDENSRHFSQVKEQQISFCRKGLQQPQ